MPIQVGMCVSDVLGCFFRLQFLSICQLHIHRKYTFEWSLVCSKNYLTIQLLFPLNAFWFLVCACVCPRVCGTHRSLSILERWQYFHSIFILAITYNIQSPPTNTDWKMESFSHFSPAFSSSHYNQCKFFSLKGSRTNTHRQFSTRLSSQHIIISAISFSK